MSVTQYVGARYVPMFSEPIDWDITKAYSPLTIVYHQGNSYTSKQSVPTGTDINNETYWALTGNYNAQIEQYRAEVAAYDARITSAKNEADTAKNEADTATASNKTQDAQIAGTTDSGLKTLITDESTARGTKDTALDAQLAGTTDSGLKTLITDESSARSTKDTALDAQLAGTTDSGLKTLIGNETNARSAKDTTIDAQLAGTADSGLKTLIGNETNARSAKDTALDAQLAGTTDSGLKKLINNNATNITSSINAHFPIKSADIQAGAITRDKLDAQALESIITGMTIRRFDSTDSTADNTGMIVPNSKTRLAGFYVPELTMLVITIFHVPTNQAVEGFHHDITSYKLPSYVPHTVANYILLNAIGVKSTPTVDFSSYTGIGLNKNGYLGVNTDIGSGSGTSLDMAGNAVVFLRAYGVA